MFFNEDEFIIRTINLHSFFCTGDSSYIQEILVEYISEATIKQCIPYILFEDLSEGRCYTGMQIADAVNEIRSLVRSYHMKYKILLDADFTDIIKFLILDDDIIYLNFFVLSSYYHCVHNSEQQTNISWNSNASKGLYTPGKLLGYEYRNLLMRKLWENHKLYNIEWSYLLYDQISKDFVKQNIFSECSDELFDDFLRDCVKPLDIDPIDKTQVINLNGYPFNAGIYSKTLYSIIAESEMHRSANGIVLKLTEKICRCIFNKHPFVLLFAPHGLTRLKDLGFKTFTEYLPDPEYNECEDDNTRLERTILNIEQFQHICKKIDTVRNIYHDIDYNHKFLMNIAIKNLKKINFLFTLKQPLNDQITDLGNFVLKIQPRMGGFNLVKAVDQ